MTAYYEGDPTPHKLFYYGTGTASKSLMSPLPPNSIAYVTPDQTETRQPTEELLANANVVDGEGNAQTLIIDGDKPFFIPTDFTAQSLTFTKSGEDHQALRLPFDTWAGLGIITEDGVLDNTPETFPAGQPVLFNGAVNISEQGRAIHAGTFAETESGYIMGADGKSLVFAENISPFTYVWEEGTGIESVDNGQLTIDGKERSVYNLAGQKVNGKLTQGLYIIDGRKVVVR
jgi:hypothetical protein